MERQPPPQEPLHHPARIPEHNIDPHVPRLVGTKPKSRNQPESRVTPDYLKGIIEQVKQTLNNQSFTSQNANSSRHSVQSQQSNTSNHSAPVQGDVQPSGQQENIRFYKVPVDRLLRNAKFHPTNLSAPANFLY